MKANMKESDIKGVIEWQKKPLGSLCSLERSY